MSKIEEIANILKEKSVTEIFKKMDILFFIIKDYLISSLPLIINFIIIIAPNFYSLVKIARLNIDIIQASMGLVIACHYVFFFIPLTANVEVLGINVSKNFSSNKPTLTSRNLYQSLISQTFIFIFGCSLFYFSRSILSSIGFDKDLSYFTGTTLMKLIPMIFLQGYNENLRNFIISCRVFNPFYLANLISTIFFIILYETYFSYYPLALDSFVISKTIQEVFNTFTFLFILKKYIPNNEYYKFRNLNNVLIDFREFFNFFYKICLGLYATMMTVQINTYYIGLTKNIDYAASWFCMTNIGEITFSVGVGFGSTYRTNIGHLIGKKLMTISLKLSKIYMIINMLFGFIWGFFILVFRTNLAYFFTTYQIAPLLSTVLIFYSFISIIDLNLFLYGCVLRTYRRETEFFIGNLIFCVLVILVTGYVLCIKLGLGVIGSCLSFLFSYILLINYFIYIFIKKINKNEIFEDIKNEDYLLE